MPNSIVDILTPQFLLVGARKFGGKNHRFKTWTGHSDQVFHEPAIGPAIKNIWGESTEPG